MKKPSMIHVTAIVLIGVCLYSIINNIGALSYGAGLSQTYAKSAISSFILILIVFSFCGIISGAGLYFYKAWSRWLAMFIAVIFIFQSLPSLLMTFSGGRFNSHIIESTVYVLFAIWCLYYLNRSDVENKFRKTKPEAESEIIKAENKILTKPRGIKITAIFLIIIGCIQIISLLLIMTKMASKISPGSGAIIFSLIILGSVLPAMGLVSGIGLIRLKTWARKVTLIFSTLSIVLYGLGVASSIALGGSSRNSGFALVFVLAYGCALPLWSLFYFTRPHIRVLFASK